nr:protein argonaute-3-like [Cherax quadricarinatus]
MLCADVSHRILRTETCYDILADLHQMHRSNFKNMAVRALVGCIVLTRYNNKSYRIDDIIFNQNPRSTFTNYKGEEDLVTPGVWCVLYTTYTEQYCMYFMFIISILFIQQGSKGFICLIPELSYMTGLTDDMRSDFRVMKDIAQHTRLTPTVRQASLRAFVKNVNSKWMYMNNSVVESRLQTSMKQRLLVNLTVMSIESDILLSLDFDGVIRDFSIRKARNLQIAVIIFPTQRDDRYAAVKRLACVELALPTQCINSRTISQDSKLRSVTQKIALQINCKLGGELWALKIPMTGLMVCGVDVYHDPTRRGESVVGFVASINQTLTKWYSHVSFQHPADEIVHGLKMSLLESLRHYHKLYHVLPRSIIMYRDGVSEGQLKLVEDHELPQLATIFHHFASYEPKLYLIVVQKRVNTRIFAAMRSRELGNPPPGSIIDHTITRRCWYDFLLVSQHVRQGTVSPTHYVVVHDGGKLKVDNMQRLTYKLTHLYYNWPGTIRVPAPCQYAHKLAFLVGESVKKHPDNKLCDRLFFL